MIRPIEPVVPRVAPGKALRVGSRGPGSEVARAEAASVVQLSDYAMARRESRERDDAAHPSWTASVIERIHKAALATQAAILRSPAVAESAQARVRGDRVLDLTTG